MHIYKYIYINRMGQCEIPSISAAVNSAQKKKEGETLDHYLWKMGEHEIPSVSVAVEGTHKRMEGEFLDHYLWRMGQTV
jgi:hypothetical protein